MKHMKREEVLIEAQELHDLIGAKQLLIFDSTVLTNQSEDEADAKGQFEAGHIPGAAFINHADLSDVNSRYQLTLPSKEDLEIAIGNLGISEQSQVVVYSTGILAWATRIWWLLKYAGFDNVRVLNGGLSAWRAIGGDIQTGSSSYPPQKFRANLQSGYFSDKNDMVAAQDDPNIKMVHTLPKPVFDEAHIPNSVCQPCSDFLHEWTTLLPNDLLKDRLVENHNEGKTITYCGGGVAATVNAIVCRLVGNPNVSVYDGSMSEWLGEGMPVNQSTRE